MSTALHAAPKPKRRGRKALLIAACLVLVPSVAFAAWFIVMTMKGSVTTGASPNIKYTTALITSESGASCSLSTSADQKDVTLDMVNAMPGSECVLHFEIAKTSGPSGLKVQDIDFVSAVDTSFTTSSDCGKVLPEGGAPIALDVVVKVPQNIAPSTTFPAGSAAGIKLVPGTDYNAADCSVAPAA